MRWFAVLAGAAALCAGLMLSGLDISGPTFWKDTRNQFRVIPLDEAQLRVRSGEYTVVEALDRPGRRSPGRAGAGRGRPPEPSAVAGAVRDIGWELPAGGEPTELTALPPGPLLIVAASRTVGYRSAAAAARAGRGDVLLFISESAEERRTLYAPLASKGAAS